MHTTPTQAGDGQELSPRQVISAFSATYTLEQARHELWTMVLPVLLSSLREQNEARADQVAAFYERLELLLEALYQYSPGEGRTGNQPSYLPTG